MLALLVEDNTQNNQTSTISTLLGYTHKSHRLNHSQMDPETQRYIVLHIYIYIYIYNRST